MDRNSKTTELSRRTFLATTSAALVGAAWGGLVPQTEAAKRHLQRGGILQYGSRTDIAGLDAHRHNQNHQIHATAAMYNGLTDIDQRGNLVPSLAESWEPNKELTAWTFRLRKGVLFHNGREFDAEAVKLNILRIQDPAIGHDFIRGGLENVDSVEVLDKYTVRINAKVADAALPISIMRYPIVLMAPDAFDTSAERPIGTGPFKFVSWTRNSDTRLVRFENYWETDAEGHSLPYLDEVIAKPKREDSVRLTALRTGQVHLIDDMAQADVERFTKEHGAKYNTWRWHAGGNYIVFNWRRGVFQDKRLRTAAAHAIDRNALHQTVYYGQGEILDQCFPRGDPWYLRGHPQPGVRSRPRQSLAQGGARSGHRGQDHCEREHRPRPRDSTSAPGVVGRRRAQGDPGAPRYCALPCRRAGGPFRRETRGLHLPLRPE